MKNFVIKYVTILSVMIALVSYLLLLALVKPVIKPFMEQFFDFSYMDTDICTVIHKEGSRVVKGKIVKPDILKDLGMELDSDIGIVMSVSVNDEVMLVFVDSDNTIYNKLKFGNNEDAILLLKVVDMEQRNSLKRIKFLNLFNIKYILVSACLTNFDTGMAEYPDSMFPVDGDWRPTKDMTVDEVYQYIQDFRKYVSNENTIFICIVLCIIWIFIFMPVILFRYFVSRIRKKVKLSMKVSSKNDNNVK